MAQKKQFNRELSWLSFNHRVLQECLDPAVPLYEKIKFMAIFSSNLDEFFRVRVASLRNLLNLKKDTKLKLDPEKLLKQIHQKVTNDQELLGKIFRGTILPGLKERNIHLLKENELSKSQKIYAEQFFTDQILPYLKPIFLSAKDPAPFLHNKALYLAVKLVSPKSKEENHAVVEIPVHQTGRFILLPREGENKYVIFIDDLMRLFIKKLFKDFRLKAVYAIKLTRDAEMYITDEFSGSLLEKIKDGIARRKTGAACRFLYEKKMPADFLTFLKSIFVLSKDDLIPGGRYHNFNDFFGFPKLGPPNDFDEVLPALPCKNLEKNEDYFDLLGKKDILLNFPYQSYNYVIQFLHQAATDERVTDIKITLYRIANPSKVVEQLVLAALNGKSVTAFVELKARFDEESNIMGADEMEQAGVKIIYSIPGIKVHSKICLVTRAEPAGIKYYAYLATGNFNEKTAQIYSDMGLLTSDSRYTYDLNRVFAFLDGRDENPSFTDLLVAPFNMRQKFEKLINKEIANAVKGEEARIIIKLNSLQDSSMIKLLYKAAQKGVKISIIVRGICCLIPDKKNANGNVQIRSIVDRYLEHSRIYIFHNGGKPKYFSGSADWMSRNLKRRVEVVFPVFDKQAIELIKQIIDLQWNDNVKGRIINPAQSNPYYHPEITDRKLRSQHEIYALIKQQNE